MSKTIYNDDLINSTQRNPFDINAIYNDYMNRNIALKYNYDIFEQFLSPTDNDKTLEFDINIPFQEKVRFIPSYLYTFKKAWIQYFCIFVPVWLILRYLLLYLFHSGVFTSYSFSFNRSLDQVNIKHKIE